MEYYRCIECKTIQTDVELDENNDRCITCGCDTFEKGHYDMKSKFIIDN